jgi:hypothetical protein
VDYIWFEPSTSFLVQLKVEGKSNRGVEWELKALIHETSGCKILKSVVEMYRLCTYAKVVYL